MAERTAEDVKRDPQSGDVLRTGPWITIESTGLLRIRWKSQDGMRGSSFRTRFRKWARTAEVIHIAQPKEKTDGE